MSVTPRGMSVQEAYREYVAGNFMVNRQYQRKLVWTVDEKAQLIDSILHGYPIPLILLATQSDSDGSKTFEIIDGMQRLNAVFAYIENEFPSQGKYFDVTQLARASQVAQEGRFVAQVDAALLLPASDCAQLLEYTFAVTEFPVVDPAAINEVFARINAYGRRLSDQERRQAGVTSPFANFIREIAAELRGDASASYLDLADMPQISVDMTGVDVAYGVRADETLWCKQGVIRKNQLREAEDEQFLADLAISILEGEPLAFSGSALNEYYDSESSRFQTINARLHTYGVDALKNSMITVFSAIRETIESVDQAPNALRRIIHPDAGGNPIKTGFYAIFMAYYSLCVCEGKTPFDFAGILGAISNLQSRLHVAAGQIRSAPRSQNIAVTKGLIQPYFEERHPGLAQQGIGLAIRFENALRRSKVETSAYECKQGLLRLDESRELSAGLLDRLVETVCGIANIGPNSSGAVFIGVADSQSDADRIEALDGIAALRVGARYVVGIEREARTQGRSLDDYKQLLVRHFSSAQLSEPLRSSVLSTIDCIDYRGRSILCIWVPPQNQVSLVRERVFVREGSNTVEVVSFTTGQAVASRFS